jgi:Protein of unknown function (DUF4232)
VGIQNMTLEANAMNVPLTRILAASGLLLLAACTGQPAPVANPVVPSIESSSSATPPPSASDTATSAPATEPAPPTEEPPPPRPANGPGECKAANLKLSVNQGDAGAGTVFRSVLFTNTSGSPCIIQGFPGVSYVTGDNGQQVGQPAVRDGAKGAAITLAPGATAAAPVGFRQVGNFDPAVCKPTPVRGLRIYPPHDTAAMFVPLDGTGCAGDPPGNQLVVKTVEPA